jgi:DnaK suppressor protein
VTSRWPAVGVVNYARAMTPAELSRWRKRLLDLRAELLREGDIEIEPGRTDDATIGADDDAQPLTEMSQSIASARNRSRADVMRRVAAALARLETAPDSFGLCVECDEPISGKRLALVPYSELCVECQATHDAPRGGKRRSLTDFH